MKKATSAPIIVVDDDPGLRNSLRFLLKNSGRRVVTFDRGEAFLAKHDGLEPGPVLLDVCLNGVSGLEVLEELARRDSPMGVILITGHGDIAMAVEAMKVGAFDFLTKPFSRENLLESIANVESRLSHREVEASHRAVNKTRLEVLTPREMEVLNELARGLPNKSIGYELGISSRTVEIHRANLMRKLGTNSLAETLRIAFAADMPLSPEEAALMVGQGALAFDESGGRKDPGGTGASLAGPSPENSE